MRCAIHSAASGSVMVIPRENKLVRLYIQMTTTEKVEGEKEEGKVKQLFFGPAGSYLIRL